ncbi:MAG: helix-turn-helix domain-containing protein [Fuerstiella sp.]
MTKRKKKRIPIDTALREAVQKSGMTVYAVARDSGVEKSQLTRFVNEERSLTLPTAEKLAAFFHLELRIVE